MGSTANRDYNQKKIGLMGPYGLGNLGDAAIQQAMISHIKTSFPDAQIFGFSLNPEDTEKRYGIPSYSIGRMARNGWIGNQEPHGLQKLLQQTAKAFRSHSSKIVRVLGRALFTIPLELISIFQAYTRLKGYSCFIVSGGGQLDDYWGGAWHHPYTLFLWGLLSKLRKAKFMFVSVGAGPLDTRAGKSFIRRALSLADYRSFRDEYSKAFIERVGFDRNDPVYPDLAFSLDTSTLPQTARAQNDGAMVVGVGPMCYFDADLWPESDEAVYHNYLTKLALFTSWLMQRGCKILLYVGDSGDRYTIQDFYEILRECGTVVSDGQIIEAPMETVEDLMSQLSAVDVVVASRFHGVLLPLLINKPVLALSYHPKIDVLMEDTGQAQFCFSIDDFEVEALQQRFLQIEQNQAAIKAEIARHVTGYKDALDEQYRKIFASL
jgi:polysaccharide pyruvyl transferase WcaK-like protein